MKNFELPICIYVLVLSRSISILFFLVENMRPSHSSKKQKHWRILIFSPKKLAEKVRKSGQQNVAANVR